MSTDQPATPAPGSVMTDEQQVFAQAYNHGLRSRIADLMMGRIEMEAQAAVDAQRITWLTEANKRLTDDLDAMKAEKSEA